MHESVILLSVPGLREKDVAGMRHLRSLLAGGEIADLAPSFPCVTCPVQANMTTGVLPREHGVVGNGFFWRDRHEIEMWTAPNDCIGRPQIWDALRQHDPRLTSAVWFPLHSRQCGADYVCTPAPVHNPDGSESLWCYTKPADLYKTMLDELGHFPLQHFWGPAAGIQSTAWIVDSAILAAKMYRPAFFNIYLPHLDYAAQRSGPDSAAADSAVAELDGQIGKLAHHFQQTYGERLIWLLAGEYVITPVGHVSFPNRVLREGGLLAVREEPDGELLDTTTSQAWALVDHQYSHVFVAERKPRIIAQVADLFRSRPGIAEVVVAAERSRYGLDHERSGDVVLISTPGSWQAYYYWLSDDRAPRFARTVDIHRKPGYDPVELCFDPATRSISIDAARVKGSHGAPVSHSRQHTVLLASRPQLFPRGTLADTDVFGIVLRCFGLEAE
jgi:predicted AlkP superfamily pyrophosphatase or phosphodiesterase